MTMGYIFRSIIYALCFPSEMETRTLISDIPPGNYRANAYTASQKRRLIRFVIAVKNGVGTFC